MKKKISEMPIEKVYIVVLAVLGFLYMIFMPPFRVSDEYRHFNRAYEVTMGQIISLEEVPGGSKELADGEATYLRVWDNRQINMQENRAKEVWAVASSYSPVSYLPASVGIAIARLFTENMLILVYIARICSFACTLWILYKTVKYMPFGKNLIIAITLLPITIQEFATLSSDSMVIALTLAVISFTFYERKQAQEQPASCMTWTEIAAMFLMAVMLGQCKYIYVFLTAIYLLIPKERFGGLKQKFIYAITLIFTTCVTMAMWLLATGVVKFGGSVATVGNEGESISFVTIIIRTFLYNMKLYVASATADSLGDLNIHPPKLLVVVFFLILVYIVIAERKNTNELKWPVRLLFLGIVLLEVAALLYTFKGYVNTEQRMIIGIQGRYFTPMLAPLSMGLTLTNSKFQCPKIQEKYLTAIMGVMNLVVVYTVFVACR